MKKFSKILAAAAALAMVSVFASCGDPDDLTARTTVDADDSGEAVSYVEIKDLTSYIVADAWDSGTKISASAPYTITEGTKWDSSGMISVPFSFDAGVLADCDFIVVNIDTSKVNLRPTEGSNYSIELKVEVPEGANKAAKCLDGTNLVKNNKIVFDIRSIKFKADAPQFMLSLRGTGTAVLTSVKGAKAENAPALPPADDDGDDEDTSVTLSWGGDTVDFGKENFSEKSIGLKIVYEGLADEGSVIKTQDMNWGSNADASYADSTSGISVSDDKTELYAWKGEQTANVIFSEDSLAVIKEYGVQIFGDAVKIISVEVIDAE